MSKLSAEDSMVVVFEYSSSAEAVKRGLNFTRKGGSIRLADLAYYKLTIYHGSIFINQ